MTSHTIEVMLANTIEELEMAHCVMFTQFTMLRKVLEDIAMVTDTDRIDFLNGMNDLAYARSKLALMRRMADDVLKDVGEQVK